MGLGERNGCKVCHRRLRCRWEQCQGTRCSCFLNKVCLLVQGVLWGCPSTRLRVFHRDKGVHALREVVHCRFGCDTSGVTIFSFLYYFARPLTRSCITLTSHHPFADALRLNPASTTPCRAWLFFFVFSWTSLLLHVQRVVLPASFYRTDHLPFISALAFPLWTPLGPCAGSSPI